MKLLPYIQPGSSKPDFHAAHLIPVFKSKAQVPKNVLPDFTLDTHQGNFYVNKYVDHHAFEITLIGLKIEYPWIIFFLKILYSN